MSESPSGHVQADAPAMLTSLSFTLNGKTIEVAGASPLLSLNDWLRVQPGLTGTKKMCSEGGCGCCVVAVSTTALEQVHNGDVHVIQDAVSTIAINSVSLLFKLDKVFEFYLRSFIGCFSACALSMLSTGGI